MLLHFLWKNSYMVIRDFRVIKTVFPAPVLLRKSLNDIFFSVNVLFIIMKQHQNTALYSGYDHLSVTPYQTKVILSIYFTNSYLIKNVLPCSCTAKKVSVLAKLFLHTATRGLLVYPSEYCTLWVMLRQSTLRKTGVFWKFLAN